MIEMVKTPKYICDVSVDVLWLPKRFLDSSMIAWAYCIHDWYDGCGADAGMWWKGYGNRRVLIFWRGELGEMGRTGSHGCGEHWRTLENAQEEILCNRTTYQDVVPASNLKSTDPQQNWHTSLLKEQNWQGHLLIVLWIWLWTFHWWTDTIISWSW